MWPWEHAVIGYLAFSVGVHLLARRSPTGPEAIVVVFASVLPDLIDKPLAWEFGVFASGYGIAHSVFFAVPLAALAVAIGTARERFGEGAAFAVGYLFHLPADLAPAYVSRGHVPFERVLWPLQSGETDYPGGFSGTFAEYFAGYVAELTSSDPSGFVVLTWVLIAGCAALWVYDGLPGLREPAAYLYAVVRRPSSDGR